MAKFKSNSRYALAKGRYHRAGVAVSAVKGPKAGPETINRKLGTGVIGIQLNDVDGFAGHRRDVSRRGRDISGYDALGFDRRGLNDDRESTGDLLGHGY